MLIQMRGPEMGCYSWLANFTSKGWEIGLGAATELSLSTINGGLIAKPPVSPPLQPGCFWGGVQASFRGPRPTSSMLKADSGALASLQEAAQLGS